MRTTYVAGAPGGSPLGGGAVLSGQRLGEAQACTCVTSPPDTRGAVLGDWEAGV